MRGRAIHCPLCGALVFLSLDTLVLARHCPPKNFGRLRARKCPKVFVEMMTPTDKQREIERFTSYINIVNTEGYK